MHFFFWNKDAWLLTDAQREESIKTSSELQIQRMPASLQCKVTTKLLLGPHSWGILISCLTDQDTESSVSGHIPGEAVKRAQGTCTCSSDSTKDRRV